MYSYWSFIPGNNSNRIDRPIQKKERFIFGLGHSMRANRSAFPGGNKVACVCVFHNLVLGVSFSWTLSALVVRPGTTCAASKQNGLALDGESSGRGRTRRAPLKLFLGQNGPSVLGKEPAESAHFRTSFPSASFS